MNGRKEGREIGKISCLRKHAEGYDKAYPGELIY